MIGNRTQVFGTNTEVPMTESTPSRPERSLHLPLQARPIERDGHSSEEAVALMGGVEAADCGDLTGMARELCYASQHGIYF
jgi:hypothetical protein